MSFKRKDAVSVIEVSLDPKSASALTNVQNHLRETFGVRGSQTDAVRFALRQTCKSLSKAKAA